MIKYILFTLIIFTNKSFSLDKKSNTVIPPLVKLNLKMILKEIVNNNIELKILKLKTRESDAKHTQSLGEFDLGITLEYSQDTQNTPVSSSLDTTGNSSSVITKTTTQKITLSQKLKTGTDISLPYTYNLVDSDSTYRTFRETHEPEIGIKINQPLIRPFIKGYYQKDLLVSKFKFREVTSDEHHKSEEIIYKALGEVFSYLESQDRLRLLNASLKTAQKNNKITQAKRKLGGASLIDTLESKGALIKIKEQFLRQSLAHKKNYENLKLTIYGHSNIDFMIKDFMPITSSSSPSMNKEIYVQNAIKHRGDYLASLLKLDGQKLKAKVANIDLYPKVALELEYENKSIKDNLNDANKDLNKGEFTSSNIGITVSHNLFRHAQKGSQALNNIKLKQEDLKYTQIIEDIKLEISVALRSFNTQSQIMTSLKKSVEMEKEKWKYYQRQFKQGQISSYELNKFQELRDQSYSEYYKSLYKLEKDYYNLFKVQGILIKELFK